ncbi:MAG: OmpH family outer membrane protein, partial [Wenzhouxiangellaceae bacterium]
MRVSIFMLMMFLAGSALAQDIRIGYVDMKRLLDNAPQVIAGRAELDIEFRPINDELLADEARLLSLEQELASASNLTAEQVADRQREIRNLDRSIARRREDLAEDL